MIQHRSRISLVFIVLAAIITSSNSQSCSLTYKTDFPDKESVLLWNPNSLIEPENDAIVLTAGDEIIVACPGSRNSIVQTGTKFSSAKCVSGQTLKIGTTNYLFSDLACSVSVTGEFLATTTNCGASLGVIKHIGHKINDNFLTLFDICYNNNNGEALYADHIIFGSAIAYAKSVSSRPGFKVGGLASGVNADIAYKQATQLITFTDLLGSVVLANKYIYSNSYLARGHLAPDGDMVFITSSQSTYFYMNTVPQWQQVNNGNWKSLEFSVRTVASTLGEDIQVITGGWEVLQLEDVNGNLVDMYLSGDKLPVPNFVWKIAYSLETQKGIAFVSVNNPFLEEITEDEYICTDICDTYGWGTSGWTNSAKGLVYCCDIDDLRDVVNTIPDFEVTGILEGPSATRSLLNKIFWK